MNENEMTVKYNSRNIIINIPVGMLVFSQNNRPEEPYRITNKRAMTKYIADNILEYCSDVGRSEIGETDFITLLDKLFTEAYESAENWIEEIDWENE
jgi:hypothetical protein